jgi:hypothetical protein
MAASRVAATLASKNERLRSSKWAEVARLPVETLRDANALDRLVQIAVDQRRPLPRRAVGVANVALPVEGEQHHQRHHQIGDQRKLPVEQQHGDGDADQVEERPRQPGDRPGEELLQHAHVADQPAHQAADAHVVVIVERQRVQVAEERLAHVADDARADISHQIDALAVEEPLGQRHRSKERCPEAERGHVGAVQPGIHRATDHPRAGDAHQRGHGHGSHRQHELAPIGAGELPEPAHQPGIVGAAQHFVVVAQQGAHLRLAPGAIFWRVRAVGNDCLGHLTAPR